MSHKASSRKTSATPCNTGSCCYGTQVYKGDNTKVKAGTILIHDRANKFKCGEGAYKRKAIIHAKVTGKVYLRKGIIEVRNNC